MGSPLLYSVLVSVLAMVHCFHIPDGPYQPQPESVEEFSKVIPETVEDSPRQRIEFQVHGLEGPNSYRFGYDTGKGYNRQFRFEERDNYGNVKGRYGFYDTYGKLQVVNYSSTPKGGFHAEGDFGKYPNNSS